MVEPVHTLAINYFGIAKGYQLCAKLDHWIRRRVRMAYWRHWRKPRTKVRNLMSLEECMFKPPSRVALPALKVGALGEEPWRSAKTPGTNQALSLGYLKYEGLYSLRDGWNKLHYPE